MAVFKCKMCGGSLEVQEGQNTCTCGYCGTEQTLPRLDSDKKANLYDRANHFRRNNDYDKAAGIYEQILNEDSSDAEAYWSLVLCRYGIEYVEEPGTHKRIPTVNRAQYTSIYADEDYKAAITHADMVQRSVYEREAAVIDEIQKGILTISEKEAPYDVFICYKETDEAGKRTQDSVLANDLYHQLVQEGFKVFFAKITLEDKLGQEYEPYIFAALNSAKVMVVLGTRPEYFKAVWVKNEWSRFLALVKTSNGKKTLIPAYKDMDPYDLPEEFSHLQAQDMSKLGFMQDLVRGIKKIANIDDPAIKVKETDGVGENSNIAPLIKRAFIFLEDGDWQNADAYCEKVLDQDPENAKAYIGKLMVDMRVRQQHELAFCDQNFENNVNFRKAIRFGDDAIAIELSGYIDSIKGNCTYNEAVVTMNMANTEEEYRNAAELFKTISWYKDADCLATQCINNAEQRKQAMGEWQSLVETMKLARKNEEEQRVQKIKSETAKQKEKLRCERDERLCGCDNEIKDLIIEIEHNKQELGSLGFLAFRRKKELEQLIEAKNKEIQSIEKIKGSIPKEYQSNVDNVDASEKLELKSMLETLDKKYILPDSPEEIERKRKDEEEMTHSLKEKEKLQDEILSVLIMYGPLEVTEIVERLEKEKGLECISNQKVRSILMQLVKENKASRTLNATKTKHTYDSVSIEQEELSDESVNTCDLVSTKQVNFPSESENVSIKMGCDGKIVSVDKKPGDYIKFGDAIMWIETHMMRIPIVANKSGVIATIDVQVGDNLSEDTIVATMNVEGD